MGGARFVISAAAVAGALAALTGPTAQGADAGADWSAAAGRSESSRRPMHAGQSAPTERAVRTVDITAPPSSAPLLPAVARRGDLGWTPLSADHAALEDIAAVPYEAPAPPVPGGVLHLTFDDGPDATWTPALLDVLAAHGVRATFFQMGRRTAEAPGLVEAVRARGHVVANHTMRHVDLTKRGTGVVAAEVAEADAVLGPTTCFRPPFGMLDATTRGTVESLGKRIVMWDVDTEDWRHPGAGVIADRIVAGARPGAVILLHDGGGDRSQTVAAVARAVPQLLAAGWRFEALPGC